MSKLADPGIQTSSASLTVQLSQMTKTADMLHKSELTRSIKQACSARETLLRACRDRQLDIQRQFDILLRPPRIGELVPKIEDHSSRFVLSIQAQIDQVAKAEAHASSAKTLGLAQSRIAEIEGVMRPRIAEIEGVMRRLRQPLLDFKSQFASLTAVTEPHTAAAGLIERPLFGEALTAVLRQDLGDWRAVTSLPNVVLTDPIARFDFYRERDFDGSLTYFPEPALAKTLNSTSLRPATWPAPVDTYRRGLDLEHDEESEDDVPELNLEAYRLVYRLETHLRRFIDEQMTAQFGSSWVKQRTPDNMHSQWWQKLKTDIDASKRPGRLIDYADFTDYSRIICRKDNWTEVFAPFFGRKSDIEESLVRLAPWRLCTMHVRLIMPDDLLLMRAETMRILRAIGIQY